MQLTSRRMLPSLAAKIAFTLIGQLMFWMTAFLRRHYRTLHHLRYPIGLLPVVIVLYMFFSRLRAGHISDLLLLPFAYLIAIVTHELGHSILYILTGGMVFSVQIALPLHGQTLGLRGEKCKTNWAQVAIAGSTANLIASLPWTIAYLASGIQMLVYLSLVNLSLFSTVLFPISKDHDDFIAAST